eukprot:CAMPEP_0116830946 /NCGR_PEP_ID=MMETSP0418-20121206/5054_1 /TAXON_ID=1158023 /ORGANISM="Astrosyne radiata, Strain 13vi08-1A" /LENGTH=103 /DNA_ID=CAMNT_0004460123 /DNA_START=291 /DNA_END=602 /DNA_ORIENTATION=+
MVLNDALGRDTPSGCYSLTHNSGEDPFTYPNDKPFAGEDDKKHRNSWLMPRFARRLTRHSPQHVSNWRKPVSVDAAECANLKKMLEDKLGAKEAAAKLPQACK